MHLFNLAPVPQLITDTMGFNNRHTAFLDFAIKHSVLELDLGKRFLPRPKTTTA